MAATIEINCVFIADGSITSIEIEGRKTMALLKDAIKERKMYGYPADQLKLFLAKEGDEWLLADCVDVTSLENGVVSERLSGIMSKEINPMTGIARLFGGAPTAMKIHVLVKIRPPALALSVEGHPISLVPLEHREELTKESLLTEWEHGSVHLWRWVLPAPDSPRCRWHQGQTFRCFGRR